MSIWRRSSGCCCRTGDCRGGWAQSARITGTVRAKPIVDGHVEVRSRGAFQNYKLSRSSPTSTLCRAGRSRWNAQRSSKRPDVDHREGHRPGERLRAQPGRVTSRRPRTDAIDLRIQSTSLDLAAIQGFTSRDQRHRHAAGGRARHRIRARSAPDGYVEMRDGAFSVPRRKRHTGARHEDRSPAGPGSHPRFQILDEHGKPLTISGELAVHERRWAPSTSRSTPTTSRSSTTSWATSTSSRT